MRIVSLTFFLIALFSWKPNFAEDGSRLWLRYPEISKQDAGLRQIKCNVHTPVAKKAKEELLKYWKKGDVELVLKRQSLREIEGSYHIRSCGNTIKIYAAQESGLLYGTYHLLRLQAIDGNLDRLDIRESPDYSIRILNHWDNLDGSVERGYAGRSLWKWNELPAKVSSRYEEYARANASIGINATVLNNVNASPLMLQTAYLQKVKVLADVFRPYGIRVFLSINFSSPKSLGGLSNADPLNPEVIDWWKKKTKEIYKLIPDFGGFLVKANSEGQPGPQDYGRSHAEGANMLATVLEPFDGVVMWRAFVYAPSSEDRAKQAYSEFVPLDGKFKNNVILQIKNGPIDFQPREPFNPLFGAMDKTKQMVEFQITQEYLGFSNHLVYLAPLFKETLASKTYSDGGNMSIADLTKNNTKKSITAIAGVANIGDNVNWCGHHFAQSNWYAFGRLAWNSDLTIDEIAEEWVSSTFSKDSKVLSKFKKIMLDSRETAVNYMMPLGLHHIFAFDHHYGPEPWGDVPGARPDWMPWYYHKADDNGIGFDRSASGSNAVAQYQAPLCKLYGDISSCPDQYLLWFHHVPWSYVMADGKTLWQKLCFTYDFGLQQVREYQKIWDSLQPSLDEQRFSEVQSKLKIHVKDAMWWRDACLLYFQTFSKMPIPLELERPIHELEELKKIKLDLKHHN